ncbi:DUF323-domain-containing protein [Karstenula rhodostoma CBS 690.94]|uniref:DUF323-domain-containing protein n=1 Tax=Karstenula rhodostoma CBS 690.94 TaxID=1392251 RepID=A0A9P4P4F7_9PLEO|nr:DUF323-domain-containing protein [Karstenula rhodostoma CBS 690.94]
MAKQWIDDNMLFASRHAVTNVHCPLELRANFRPVQVHGRTIPDTSDANCRQDVKLVLGPEQSSLLAGIGVAGAHYSGAMFPMAIVSACGLVRQRPQQRLVAANRDSLSIATRAKMVTETPKFEDHLRSTAVAFGNSPLLVLPNGATIDLATGYIPLLVNFTHEDKAAKGLRKRTANDKPQHPVYFSAIELVRDHQVLLLSGNSGSGKTTFGKYLCFGLATEKFNKARLVPRNDFGAILAEVWNARSVIPCYLEVNSLVQLRDVVDRSVPNLVEEARVELVIVIDVTLRVEDEVSALLTSLIDRVRGNNHAKIVLLGDTRASQCWKLPANVARYDLLPLLESQRRQALSHLLGIEESQVNIAIGQAAGNPAIFALSAEAGSYGNESIDSLEAWLSRHASGEEEMSKLVAQAFNQFQGSSSLPIPTWRVSSNDLPLAACSKAVQRLLAARQLAQTFPNIAVDLYHEDPYTWEPVIYSLLERLAQSVQRDTVIEGLVEGSSPSFERGALLVASSGILLPADIKSRIKATMLQIIRQAALPPAERRSAGRILSQLDDPRRLEELVEVKAGTSTLGCDMYTNSRPTGLITVGSYRIGVYPVVNRDYIQFVEETGRSWRSAEGRTEGRRNLPVTDVTWHDARAYCSWVTHRWQKAGKIQQDEHVRLPTEIEWERASRGDSRETRNDDPIWPWGSVWGDDTANFEETGFNEPCAVGLFPSGRSPYGCYDMTGQVWEWCSTLWGEDMSTPSFQYPYRSDDGREDEKAPDNIRRVLRGGCFSSGRLKVTSAYRGSLEPTGFWRGNGFRVVVARNED